MWLVLNEKHLGVSVPRIGLHGVLGPDHQVVHVSCREPPGSQGDRKAKALAITSDVVVLRVRSVIASGLEGLPVLMTAAASTSQKGQSLRRIDQSLQEQLDRVLADFMLDLVSFLDLHSNFLFSV